MLQGLAFTWARLRHQWGRSAAVVLSLAIAVTAFVVLTSTARESRLVTVRTVNENYRSAYDILVRPKNSQTDLERSAGLVRPNYLSGIFGGITWQQLREIRQIPGTSVVAPIAMIGQVLQTTDVPVDVSSSLGGGRDAVGFTSSFVSARGQARAAGPAGYVYVTPNRLTWGPLTAPSQSFGAVERQGHRSVTTCRHAAPARRYGSPFEAARLWQVSCWSRVSGDPNGEWSPLGSYRYPAYITVSIPVTVAAVDPAAEAALAGLDGAVVAGRYLRQSDRPERLPAPANDSVAVPVIASSRPVVNERLIVKVHELPRRVVEAIHRGRGPSSIRHRMARLTDRPVRIIQVRAGEIVNSWLDAARLNAPAVDGYWVPGQVDYAGAAGGVLHPQPTRNGERTWASNLGRGSGGFVAVPPDAQGTAYRELSPHRLINSTTRKHGGLSIPVLDIVGTFDPYRIRGFSALSQVPLETYRAPTATPANRATERALGGQPLLPNMNPAGYLQSPPLLLTTLRGLRAFHNPAAFTRQNTPKAPISVVRVRVAGVTGADPVSRERIRLVAQRIQESTGLHVDITIGSSPAPQEVRLRDRPLGTPPFTVVENWVKKGVATQVIAAIDRKSLALFILILVSSGLAVANATNASVRARRRELGVLACLGWRRRTLIQAVCSELLILGLTAGIIGSLASIPVSHVLGSPVGAPRALLAVPVALLVVFISGVAPALWVGSIEPIFAVRPPGSPRLPKIPLRGVVAVAISALIRTPGRFIAAALSVSLGIASLIVLLSIALAFQGDVVGTLLGDAVALQVRTPDIVAGAFIALLGIVTVLDLIYLDLREQAPKYASLQATGWTDARLMGLLVWQAALTGFCGALVGAAGGIAAVNWLVSLNQDVIKVAAAVAVAAVITSAVAVLIPALAIRRLPTARLLAEE